MSSRSIFEPIVSEMEKMGDLVSRQVNFQKYLSLNKFKKTETCSSISIDSIKKLDPFLKEKSIFVFRLGTSSEGRGTSFACVSYGKENDLPFLIDSDIFRDLPLPVFTPNVPELVLSTFSLIPKFTETSVINFGLATGLIQVALGIESEISIPATGQGTYSFVFHPKGPQFALLYHHNGQIEIDAAFTGKRKGKNFLFILEGKCSSKFDSLAKHKLAYPFFALQNNVKENIEVRLIYCRVLKKKPFYEYYLAECKIEGNNLDSFNIVNKAAFKIKV